MLHAFKAWGAPGKNVKSLEQVSRRRRIFNFGLLNPQKGLATSVLSLCSHVEHHVNAGSAKKSWVWSMGIGLDASATEGAI